MPNSSLQPTPISAPKIAIIGAGLTGLFTATLLERASSQMNEQKINDKSSIPEITIFEKSRSVGRLATRYRSDSLTDKNWQWAFGAQLSCCAQKAIRLHCHALKGSAHVFQSADSHTQT